MGRYELAEDQTLALSSQEVSASGHGDPRSEPEDVAGRAPVPPRGHVVSWKQIAADSEDCRVCQSATHESPGGRRGRRPPQRNSKAGGLACDRQ